MDEFFSSGIGAVYIASPNFCHYEQAKMNALVQARRQFGSGAGSVTIVGCKEA